MPSTAQLIVVVGLDLGFTRLQQAIQRAAREIVAIEGDQAALSAAISAERV
jgi:hypothetical protein